MEKAITDSRAVRRATAMLVVVTVLWGLSFVLMKDWQAHSADCPGGYALGSCTLIAVRMALALAVLGIFRRRLFTEATRREHTAGALIGVVFFAGFFLQTLGLAWTTPALSAFITSLGSAWVPVIAWVVFRTRVRVATALGLIVAIMGTALLVGGRDLDRTWGPGELLTLASSVVFASEILMLDRLGRGLRSGNLTVGFMATAGLCGLVGGLGLALAGPGLSGWSAWTADVMSRPEVAGDVILLVVFSTVLAFHWMNVYQPRVSASRAALVYLLEPVFSSVFSVAVGFDVLSATMLSGGGLVIAGNLLVELPGLAGNRADEATRPASGDAPPGLT